MAFKCMAQATIRHQHQLYRNQNSEARTATVCAGPGLPHRILRISPSRGGGCGAGRRFSHVFATHAYTALLCNLPHYRLQRSGAALRDTRGGPDTASILSVPQAAIIRIMALAACSISTPLGDLEKAPTIAHFDLTERERERELDKYASPVPI